MTALQLNSEFFAVMSEISAKKGLLEKVLDFLPKRRMTR